MNLKTTLILLVFAAAGGAFLWYGPTLVPQLSTAPTVADAGTRGTLEDALAPEKVTAIEVIKGDRRIVLQRSAGGEWSMPGRWPVRKHEVEQLVGLITHLRSRFAPIPLTPQEDLKQYGLEPPALVLEVKTEVKSSRLAFGEESGDVNRFSRPTYVRLDDKPEILRLGPGLIAALDRPQEFYQQRRLFPSERVARDTDSQEKVDRLAAKDVAVKGTEGTYRLKKAADDWELAEPIRDHVDPDRMKGLLTALPDLWAEQFIDKPEKDLDKYGLKTPEKTIEVTRPSGDTITLLIGKPSQTKTRMVSKPAPPMGGPQLPPQREVVHDEYRFARLQDNEQVFEIKAERLKDLFVTADTLRDARLARFRPEDARRVELTHSGQDIVLTKEKDRWKLEKPMQSDAETSKVTEVLDKLSFLQARDKDIVDKPDLKKLGLDKPAATIKVTVEEEVKEDGETKSKKTKTFGFALAKNDTDKGKLWVKVDGWDRVNSVEDAVLKLAERPALAYRGRRVLDFSGADLAKIDVQRGSDKYTLENVKGKWSLAAPTSREIDSSKAGQFASDLGRLEVVEFVSEAPTPENLKDLYGLTQPALTVKLAFSDAKKPAAELLVGKQRPGKDEWFAKLAAAPGVFVIRKDTRDQLDRDSLAYLPQQPWQFQADDIAELKLKKGDLEYRLKKDGSAWKIVSPFEAVAVTGLVQPIVEQLTGLRSERYVAHAAQDAAKFGLDKPTLSLTVVPVANKDAPAAKEQTLLIGKEADGEPKGRYARLADGPAVFVVAEPTTTALDKTGLDLLDRAVLSMDAKAIERIRSSAGGGLTLQKQDKEWKVTQGPGAPYPADKEIIGAVLGAWSNLQAQRFAAYGPLASLAAYGLDKPAFSLTVTAPSPAVEGKPAAPVEHTLHLGKPVEGSPGERFAKFEKSAGIVVLPAATVTELTRGSLDFVNRSVLEFDSLNVTSLVRQMGSDALEVARREGNWQVVKPANAKADGESMEALLKQLSSLRAQRVAAYPATELKSFDLNPPVASVTLKLGGPDTKGKEHELQIGKVADEKAGDRFAVVDESKAVVVLPGALVRRLLAPPLNYRDRNLARFPDADRITLQRDRRQATFAKVDGTWKLVEPTQAEADQTELEEFLNTLARLRADELVADKPADLKPFGLDRPEVRWRLLDGDKEVLNLLIGTREMTGDKEGPRRFAKLANGDLVFLLEPGLTAKVQAEYRNRTLWTNLDAAQVERLEYRYPNNPFALEKVDNTWRVVGIPDAKVDQSTIQQTLDALAGLKTVEYVEDRSRELPLYGLEPPELVLEIQTRTGRRVLHVGRKQGESERLYARVPEGGRTDVIVISDVDAKRIVRNLAGFASSK